MEVKDTEDANFYYDLTDLNIEYIKHGIASITNHEVKVIEKYINEIQEDSWLNDFISKNLKIQNIKDTKKLSFLEELGGMHLLVRLNQI